MKKTMILLAVAVLTLTFASCEKDLESYNDQTSRLNFVYGSIFRYTLADLEKYYAGDSYNNKSYSFIYDGNGTDRDTVWFKIGVSGFLKDYPRPVAFQQITVGDTVDNAEAGLHYVAFTDPALTSCYTVPANVDTLNIPVILLRDPSLEKKDVVLRFGFMENDYFQVGIPEMSYRTLWITARLVEPKLWPADYFGKWGQLKHELMVKWTGKKWDYAYNLEFYASEYAYRNYLSDLMVKKLDEENKKRIEAGEDIYREANGTPVDFTPIED